MTRRGRLVVPVLAALVLTGCGGDGDAGDTPPQVTASPLVEPTDEPTDGPTDEPSGTASPSEGVTATPTTTELSGEPYDGPPLGGRPGLLDVVGVSAGDVLNVRAGPGTDRAVVATLAPLETDVVATGRGRLLPSSIWVEVEVDGVVGWTSSAFVGYLGATDDITSQLVGEGGALPSAETLLDLAQAVGELVASEDPPSRIVVTDGPSVGDLGEVTVDVIGLGDDAGLGLRLVVFATEDEGGESWTVKTVEATQICGRGEDTGGGCP